MGGWKFDAIVADITDGDTYELDLILFEVHEDLGFWVTLDFELKIRWPVRLHGIDVYESHTEKGKEATETIKREILPAGTRVKVWTERVRFSFRRFVARIALEDGTDLAAELRRRGYAKPPGEEHLG